MPSIVSKIIICVIFIAVSYFLYSQYTKNHSLNTSITDSNTTNSIADIIASSMNVTQAYTNFTGVYLYNPSSDNLYLKRANPDYQNPTSGVPPFLYYQAGKGINCPGILNNDNDAWQMNISSSIPPTKYVLIQDTTAYYNCSSILADPSSYPSILSNQCHNTTQVVSLTTTAANIEQKYIDLCKNNPDPHPISPNQNICYAPGTIPSNSPTKDYPKDLPNWLTKNKEMIIGFFEPLVASKLASYSAQKIATALAADSEIIAAVSEVMGHFAMVAFMLPGFWENPMNSWEWEKNCIMTNQIVAQTGLKFLSQYLAKKAAQQTSEIAAQSAADAAAKAATDATANSAAAKAASEAAVRAAADAAAKAAAEAGTATGEAAAAAAKAAAEEASKAASKAAAEAAAEAAAKAAAEVASKAAAEAAAQAATSAATSIAEAATSAAVEAAAEMTSLTLAASVAASAASIMSGAGLVLMVTQIGGMIADSIDPCSLKNNSMNLTQKELDLMRQSYDKAMLTASQMPMYPYRMNPASICEYKLDCSTVFNSCLSDSEKAKYANSSDYCKKIGDTDEYNKYLQEYLSSLTVNSSGECIGPVTNAVLANYFTMYVGGIDWSFIAEMKTSDFQLPKSSQLKVLDLILSDQNTFVAGYINNHFYYFLAAFLVIVIILFVI